MTRPAPPDDGQSVLNFTSPVATSISQPPSPEVTKATEEAIDRARRGTAAEWRVLAINALYGLCLNKAEFTSDDLWGCLEIDGVEPPREPSALGPIMRVGKGMGWAETTNMTRESSRPIQHRKPQRVWRSLIYQN